MGGVGTPGTTGTASPASAPANAIFASTTANTAADASCTPGASGAAVAASAATTAGTTLNTKNAQTAIVANPSPLQCFFCNNSTANTAVQSCGSYPIASQGAVFCHFSGPTSRVQCHICCIGATAAIFFPISTSTGTFKATAASRTDFLYGGFGGCPRVSWWQGEDHGR